jgi:hypothetical protein
VTEVVFAGYLEIMHNTYSSYDNDPKYIKNCNGAFKVYKDLSRFCRIERLGEKDVLNFTFMPPSFTCVVKTKYPEFMKEAVRKLNDLVKIPTKDLSLRLFKETPLSGFNQLLFVCD